MARSLKRLHTALRSLLLRASCRVLASLAFLLVLLVFEIWFALRIVAPPRASLVSSNAFHDKPTSYVFVFSTGRCGTQHLSRALKSLSSPRAYITHEEEHLTERTRVIVDRVYRRLALRNYSATTRYVRDVKIPFYEALLHMHGATRLVYTGHVPMAFGLGPALMRALPTGAVRVVRLRRERLATALSLMALGPDVEDPWGDAVRRRWFPVPTDRFVRLKVSGTTWRRLNRFQKWLWYVDDVECRWQAMKREFVGDWWKEVTLEGLAVMDGGAGWRDVAKFMGVAVGEAAAKRHNSIQGKGRVKDIFEETVLRKWDEEYREIVGACHLDEETKYTWR